MLKLGLTLILKRNTRGFYFCGRGDAVTGLSGPNLFGAHYDRGLKNAKRGSCVGGPLVFRRVFRGRGGDLEGKPFGGPRPCGGLPQTLTVGGWVFPSRSRGGFFRVTLFVVGDVLSTQKKRFGRGRFARVRVIFHRVDEGPPRNL